jgi:FAD/FMN-containing dehydrogenase
VHRVGRAQRCEVREILDRVADKWSLLAIALLEQRTLRFSELQRWIDGSRQRMLTVTLRQLERDGLVCRRVYPVVPRRSSTRSPARRHAARHEPVAHHVDRGASARAEPELFWALRGGGGNFGVVTRLKYRLHPVDTVVGGLLLLPATPEVIAGFVAAAEAAPDELSAIANVMLAPPLPFVPEELHGTLVVMARMVYAGDVEAGRRAVAPFRALAEPVADLLRPMKYPEVYPDEERYRLAAVARTMFASSVGSRQAETILQRIGESSAMMAVCEMRVLGGAMARVPADATAFAHRQSRMMINVAAIYDPSTSERSEHAAWVRGLSAELDDGDPGAYAGLLADEGEQRVRAASPGATWERLTAVKAIYDPDNVFRLNQNIPPAA